MTSTDDGIAELERHGYDVVITNCARPPDDNAAITFLDRLKDLQDQPPPVLIYAGREDRRREETAIKHRAFGYATQPRELYELVTNAIAGSSTVRRG